MSFASLKPGKREATALGVGPQAQEEGGGAPAHEEKDPSAGAAEGAGQAARELDPDAPSLSPDELRASIEALLYASSEPLSLNQLRKALPEVPPEAVAGALEDLLEHYRGPGRGLHIVEVAGGYQISTRPEYHDRVSRLLETRPPARLSIQALETLAAIAYRQPITIPELMALRGVRSASVVRTLLEKKLIRILGRKNVVGRPILYGTTKEFLLRFGLKDLEELPRLRDMAEVFGEEVAQLEELDKVPEPSPSREPKEGDS